MITLYGINNCDKVRAARKWLEQHGIEYDFHDVREDGLSASAVQGWLAELGWETLVNRRSRQLENPGPGDPGRHG